MTAKIPDKLLKAYFRCAEKMNADPDMAATSHYFHRTKKYAFSVRAERLGKDGR